jgi:hypothetical protein
MDKRFDFYKYIADSTIEKLEAQRNKMDLITYCLDELKGCEKLYGLMFIFTEIGKLAPEDADLIRYTNVLIIGDMMNLDDAFVEDVADKVVDSFYTFAKVNDGYLVDHNYVEMQRYFDMRKNN